jgi:hypothetical protein
MLEDIKKYFRKRRLQKESSKTPTGLMTLGKISSANFVIDVEEQGFDLLKEDILAWGRSHGIKVNIYFLDFRKISKQELLLTSIQTTILKKDLNWLGFPGQDKMTGLVNEKTDMFVSLVDSSCPAIDYITKCSDARFKVGRRQYEGHAFDMIISGAQTDDLRSDSRLIFKAMLEYISKIK